ncbi:hypothetical protein GQ649_33100 [Rhodococcus sp. DSM 6344]|nr:hypothetical protein [Rhodococcus erythropolis]
MNALTSTTETTDQLGLVSGYPLVLIGAELAGDRERRIVFHYGEGVATVHIAGYGGVASYNENDSSVPLVTGKTYCGGIADCEVQATPEQADRARRILTLLRPYLPDESDSYEKSISNGFSTFLDILTARAEQYVWCIRTSTGHILYASATGYSDSAYNNILSWHVVDDGGLAEYGIVEGEESDHLSIERVPEADIPVSVKIEGIAST